MDLPFISFSGNPTLEPRSVGYLTWHLLAQETLVCSANAAPLCDTGVSVHLSPCWFAEVECKIVGDQLGRTSTYRIAGRSGQDIVFFLESTDHLAAAASSRHFAHCSHGANQRAGRRIVNRGAVVATLTIRPCYVPGCDHSDCD